MKNVNTWLASFGHQVNQIYRNLEEGILRGTVDGILDLQLTASVIKGATGEIEKQTITINDLNEKLIKANNLITKLQNKVNK